MLHLKVRSETMLELSIFFFCCDSIVGKPPRKDAARLTCRPTAAYKMASSFLRDA